MGTTDHLVTAGSVCGPVVRRVATLMVTVERCDGCRYPDRCASDSTCWDAERDVGREVGEYRRQRRRP